MVPVPQWHLDDERIFDGYMQLNKYNATVWQMVYNYSSLSPGEYVFRGEIKGAQSHTAQLCCGPQPEVILNLSVAAGKFKCL